MAGIGIPMWRAWCCGRTERDRRRVSVSEIMSFQVGRFESEQD